MLFFSVYDFFARLFRSNYSKLITKEEYPIKILTDLKEGDILFVLGFTKQKHCSVLQKLADYQNLLNTGKIKEETFFFLRNDFLEFFSLDVGKTYKVVSKNGFPSLEKVSVFLTE